jgi:hypothetical protein
VKTFIGYGIGKVLAFFNKNYDALLSFPLFITRIESEITFR